MTTLGFTAESIVTVASGVSNSNVTEKPFARNREEVAAMIRYAVADGLAAEAIPPEALFHPSTLQEPA